MASGKNFAGWVSGELLARAQRRVDEDYAGNASAYVVDLVKRDTAGREVSDAPDAVVLVALARRFHPSLVKKLEGQLSARGEVNHARVAFLFVEALSQALAEPDFDPEKPFRLIEPDRTAVERAVELLADRYGLRDLAGAIGETGGEPPAGEKILDAAERRARERASAHASRGKQPAPSENPPKKQS